MTHLVDLTAPIPSSLRRHTDPPALWVAVISISITLHLIGLWLLTGFVVRLRNVQGSEASIPIDVVELAPNSKSAATRQNRLVATKKSKVSKVVQTSKRKTSVHHSGQPTLITASPIPQKSTATRPTHISTTTPPSRHFPATRTTPRLNTAPFGQPTPIASLPIGSPQPNPFPTGPARSDERLPPPPNPNQPPFHQQPTPPRGTGSSQTTGVRGSIVNFQLGNGGRDIPSVMAQPRKTSETLPQQNYSVQLRRSFGQVVVFRVLIDSTGGKPARIISLQHSSENSQYDELAKNLLQNWDFDPATSNGQPVQSLLDISLKIDPL